VFIPNLYDVIQSTALKKGKKMSLDFSKQIFIAQNCQETWADSISLIIAEIKHFCMVWNPYRFSVSGIEIETEKCLEHKVHVIYIISLLLACFLLLSGSCLSFGSAVTKPILLKSSSTTGLFISYFVPCTGIFSSIFSYSLELKSFVSCYSQQQWAAFLWK
jgi:hypothetical protein